MVRSRALLAFGCPASIRFKLPRGARSAIVPRCGRSTDSAIPPRSPSQGSLVQRACHAFAIDPDLCQCGREALAGFTGKAPKRETSGQGVDESISTTTTVANGRISLHDPSVVKGNYTGLTSATQSLSEFVKQAEAQMSDRRLYRSRRRFARIDAGTIAFIICAIGLVVSMLLIRANQMPNQKLQTTLSVAVGHPIAQAIQAKTARGARAAPELR